MKTLTQIAIMALVVGALANYKVENEDGTEFFVQIDPEDDVQGGKGTMDAFKAAVKSDDSPVKAITKADPPSGNEKASKS